MYHKPFQQEDQGSQCSQIPWQPHYSCLTCPHTVLYNEN
jgi:hypothetical protein